MNAPGGSDDRSPPSQEGVPIASLLGGKPGRGFRVGGRSDARPVSLDDLGGVDARLTQSILRGR